MLSVLGTKTAADGGDVSPKLGRKSKLTQSPMKSEAHAVPLCQRWVVHVQVLTSVIVAVYSIAIVTPLETSSPEGMGYGRTDPNLWIKSR